MSGGRFNLRVAVTAVAALVAMLALAAGPAQAVKIQNPSPPDFSGELTGGLIQLAGKDDKLLQLPLEFPIDPSTGQPANPTFRGTIDAAGSIHIPKAQLVFPALKFEIKGSMIDIYLKAVGDATGAIDPLSGRVDLDIPMQIQAMGNVTVTDPITITVNLGNKCVVGTPEHPMMVHGTTHMGASPAADQVYVADFIPDGKKFDGGLMPAGPYSDEPGVWPDGPKPDGIGYELVPRAAGSFRLADETLKAEKVGKYDGSDCGAAVNSTFNKELGLPSVDGQSTAILDFQFTPSASRPGNSALVQKGVKSNFTIPGFTAEEWLSTEVPEIPTLVPFEVRAGQSYFAAGVGPHPDGGYSFDLGDGEYGPFTDQAVQELSFDSVGPRTIRVRARDADGDIDVKTREIMVVPSTDISVGASAEGGSFRGGSSGRMLVDLTNQDEDRENTQPITLTVELPEGTGFDAAEAPAGWECTHAAGTVSCGLPAGQLGAGATDRIAIDLSVAADADAELSATATVQQAGDPDSADDSASLTIPVRKTDLSVELSHQGDVVANGTVAFEVAVRNVGDGETAGDTTVELALPTGLSPLLERSGGEGWSCSVGTDPAVASCVQNGEIAAGEEAPALQVWAAVDRTASGAASADATVSTGGDTGAFGGIDQANDAFEVLVRPDLALEVGAGGGFVVGDEGEATFVATNESVLAIEGPTEFTSTLPDGLTVGSVSGTGWDCSATEPGSASISCSYAGGLAPLESAPQLVAHLGVGHGAYPATEISGTLDNDLDGFGGNDAGSASTAVRRLDLSIVKSAVRDFSVGIEGQYRLSVSNVGDADTVGPIRVVDELPPELSLAGVSGGGWDCSASIAGQQLVECVTDSVVAAGSAAPLITVRVNVSNEAADLGEVTNVATVDTERDDRAVEADAPVNGNNSDSEVTKAVSVDLSIESRHANAFRVGTDRSYSLKVRNVGFFGTKPGEPVTVADRLPVGMVPDEEGIWVDRAGWQCGAEAGTEEAPGHLVTCVLAAPDPDGTAMGKGETATIEIPVRVEDEAVEPSVNVAEVSTARDDSVERSPNNRSEDPTEVTRIDLETTAEATIAPRAGGIGELAFDLANHGNTATIGPADLTVSLPEGVSFRPQGSTLTGWECVSSGPGAALSCRHPQAIPAGGSAPPLRVRTDVSIDAPDEWETLVTARTEGEVDGLLADNDLTLTQQLEKVDLRMLRSHEPGAIKAGRHGEYTLAVENLGNAESAGVTTVEETIPAGFTEPRASGPGWDCRIDGRDLSCTRTHPIAAGESTPPITVNFLVPADLAGTRQLSATLHNGSDPYPAANNTAEDTITIVAAPDAAISVDQPATMRVGDPTNITYRVRNVGTEATSGNPAVDLVVFLPENVEPVGTTSSDAWDCHTSNSDGYRYLSCGLSGSLAPGEGSSITATVRLLPSDEPVTQVAASVKTVGDPNPANDSVSGESDQVGVDLVTAVEAPVEEMEAEAPNRRSILVANQGSTATTGTVRVRVPLPAGVSWSEGTSTPGTGWECGQPGSVVVCSNEAALAAGASLPTLSLDLVPSRANAPSVEVAYSAETIGEADEADNTVTRQETVIFWPETVIDSAPEGTTTAKSARIEFSSDDPEAGFECRTDGEFEPCSSPLRLDGLGLGGHGVQVRAVNSRDMADPTPAEASWVVTAIPPDGESNPVRMNLSEGSLDLAALGKVKLEAGQLALEGGLFENGAIEVPPSGVVFSPVQQKVDAPGLGVLDVKISISAIGPGSGSLSPDGGASLSLPVQAKLEAGLGGAALIGPEADCYLRPVQFDLSGTWDEAAETVSLASNAVSLPAASAGCGALGGVVDSMLGLPRDDISASFEFDLERTPSACAEGEVGAPPDCRPARVDLAVQKVRLNKKKVKPGGKVKVKVRVANRGDLASGKVKVCLKAPRKVFRGKAKRCRAASSVAAGKAATIAFTVRAKKIRARRRQAVLKVTVPTGDGTGHRTVKRKVTVKRKR